MTDMLTLVILNKLKLRVEDKGLAAYDIIEGSLIKLYRLPHYFGGYALLSIILI